VIDATESSRSVQNGRLYRVTRIITIRSAMLVIGIVGGYLYGLQSSYHDIALRDNTIRQMLAKGQVLKTELTETTNKLTELQAKFKKNQASLDAIVPSKDTYNLRPNQSYRVANGQLVIGLVGVPTSQGVNINVNGKQQLLVTGDSIKVAPDPSRTCHLIVQSFDMFKAVVTASCDETKP